MSRKTKIGIVSAVAAIAVAVYSAITITGTGQSITITDDAVLVGNFNDGYVM